MNYHLTPWNPTEGTRSDFNSLNAATPKLLPAIGYLADEPTRLRIEKDGNAENAGFDVEIGKDFDGFYYKQSWDADPGAVERVASTENGNKGFLLNLDLVQ